MDPFVAEVRVFSFNFAPKGWAFCSGQLLPLSQNTALFSLLGTMYGGDGKSTFALPNLEGSAAVGAGQGPGLSQRYPGEQSGTPTVTLLQSEIPAHTHGMQSTLSLATTSAPSAQTSFSKATGGTPYKAPPFGTTATLNIQAMSVTGSSFPHNNMMPYLCLNFCIALQGVFPPRS